MHIYRPYMIEEKAIIIWQLKAKRRFKDIKLDNLMPAKFGLIILERDFA